MKTNESGRSMIEMLGVLAIIGVLSIGGIAGYAKAMAKHRINKTVEQLTQITASTRALFVGHKTYEALANEDNAKKLILRAHLVPDDMMILTAGNTLDKVENAYGGTVTFGVAGKKTADDKKAFTLTYDKIPQAACIDIATQDWGNGSTSGLLELKVNETEAKSFGVGAAVTACSSSNDNVITWTFY